MELSDSEDDMDLHDNIIKIPNPPMLQNPSNLYPFNANVNAVNYSDFQLPTRRLDMLSAIDRNPFNTTNPGVIPGPVSLQCDNIQFIKSWIKYIFQSTISVTFHTVTFLMAILWIRFVYSSYYQYQYTHNKDTNDISKYKISILSYLPFSSWIWIAISLTNIILFLGYMIQCWIIPIQWNFEDNSNTKLFRYFGIIFIFIVIMTTITFNILQMISYSFSYNILIISQIIIVMVFSFILLFVIIKNGRNDLHDKPVLEPNDNNNEADSSSESSTSPNSEVKHKNANKEIYQKIKTNSQQKTKMSIIAAFANKYSCSKLVLICILFSVIITLTIASFHINFHFVLSFILHNNSNKHMFFDKNFTIHLMITIFGTLLIGDLLILFMRILMRWLTILLSDSYNGNNRKKHSISWSYNAHYGSMQSFNKMILFAIPLMFIIKLSVFVMLYTFIDAVEFAVAIIIFCIFSRCFNKIFIIMENNMIRKLTNEENNNNKSDYYDDEYSIRNLQDHHFLAQCNYIHDIIHYIITLLIPILFGLFRVNFDNKYNSSLSHFHYLQTAVIQVLIQLIFDLFPLLIILIVNPTPNTSFNHTKRSLESFYPLSHSNMQNINQEIKQSNYNCCHLSKLAMNLKIEYINMMNGWTATDKCVRHFMWWCTIFIGGYFAFYLLYPQQFLCVNHKGNHNAVFENWMYIQCQ